MSESFADDGQRQPKLCQNQVENLVRKMESVSDEVWETAAECNAAPVLEPELLAAVRSLHQGIASEFSEVFGEIVRTRVDVEVADLATVQASPPGSQHGWHTVLSPEAFGDDWRFDVAPALCCVMVDRMLGGDPTEGETFSRPMTSIERRLMRRVAEAAVGVIREHWGQRIDTDWMVRHEPDATRLPVPQLQIRFNVGLCQNRGTMRLWIPIGTIETFRAAIEQAKPSLGTQSGSGQRIVHHVAAAPIEVVANLATSTIRTGDLLQLRVGDLIATEKGIEEPLELTIQGVPKFLVRAGALNGNKAIQIEDVG